MSKITVAGVRYVCLGPFSSPNFAAQIPVALALWNQVGSECKAFHLSAQISNLNRLCSRPAHSNLCVLQSQRLCAVFLAFSIGRGRGVPAVRGHDADAA